MSDRHHDVRAFHARFGHPVREAPAVPTDEEMRFRLKLIAEEFCELLEASLDESDDETHADFRDAIERLRGVVGGGKIYVDLPALVDAMADLDYVVEGTRAVCGVDGRPVHALVHRANMAKDPVYVELKDAYHRMAEGTLPDGARHAFITRKADGPIEALDPTAKPTKPATWRAPDVEGELERQKFERRQGYVDDGSDDVR